MFPNESSEHEPEEPDPGAAAEAHDFDVTTGEDLVDRLPDASEAPRQLRRRFWAVVWILKFALMATSLGLLLAYFWGWHVRGGALATAGVVAFVVAAVLVRRFQGSD